MQRPSPEVLRYYAGHSSLSDPGPHDAALKRWPKGIDELMAIVQGLLVYDVVCEPFYGFKLPAGRDADIHLRSAESILGKALEVENRPLRRERAPEHRVAGRCRNFVLLLVSALREKGVPARARCGFAAYFNSGTFEDHWVCEYWDGAEGRWRFADPQFDATWKRNLEVEHDVTDVPRAQMLVAADAWRACRDGHEDAGAFGINFTQMYGLWVIAGNLVRDLASLNKHEMLPWDVWGPQPQPGDPLSKQQVKLFDELSRVTRDPDASFDALRELYEATPELKVPSEVFNAIRGEVESAL